MTPEQIIDRYCLAWSAEDPMEREQHLRAVWDERATYTDPRASTATTGELLAHIARIQAQRPGARVWRTSRVDVHHRVGRFHFEVAQPDGSIALQGTDFVELSDDGTRLVRVIGFFGALS